MRHARTTRRVRYDGPAVAVGKYLPGQVYEVDAEEAERLITVKAFTDADAETSEPAVKE